jgi:hypothetical protein
LRSPAVHLPLSVAVFGRTCVAVMEADSFLMLLKELEAQ